MSTTQINNNIVDLSTLPQTTPSMCIPRVFSNITKERILGIFNDLNIGSIERIDQVFRTNDDGAHFQRVFVHIRWNDDEISNKARTRLLQGKDISDNVSNRFTLTLACLGPRNDVLLKSPKYFFRFSFENRFLYFIYWNI